MKQSIKNNFGVTQTQSRIKIKTMTITQRGQRKPFQLTLRNSITGSDGTKGENHRRLEFSNRDVEIAADHYETKYRNYQKPQ